jgi:hypothetical protein
MVDYGERTKGTRDEHNNLPGDNVGPPYTS